VARLLADEHVRLTITDPKALDNAKMDLADLESVNYELDEYKAVEGADAVVVMTDWRHYHSLDWQKIFDLMRKPALVFDTRNCLDRTKLKEIGFNVLNIGK
jgi:UDPglucose 6-dehydrogenase